MHSMPACAVETISISVT